MQHNGRHECDELWNHSSEIPFGIHLSHGSNKDEHKAGALFVDEDEERQYKHNQKLEERSSQGCLTPKVLRNRGRNEKGADNIKNVMMLSFGMTNI